MTNVVEAIAPIFIIIVAGYFIQKSGLVAKTFFSEANRFVLYVSLPFLLFTGIVKSSPGSLVTPAILSVIMPTFAVLGISLSLGAVLGLRKGRLGTFSQTAFHGNVSYIGLAVLFYLLGEGGLSRGSILTGFLILVNNGLAVLVLSLASQKQKRVWKPLLSVATNPVIISAFLAMVVVHWHIAVPGIILRSMAMVASIALPLALIIIGASMSLETVKKTFALSSAISVLKLFALPGISLLLCRIFDVPAKEALPGIILLATPTATTAYIFAHQVGGDPELASGAITLSTLASPAAFIFWTVVVGM
jgi:predicted permease